MSRLLLFFFAFLFHSSLSVYIQYMWDFSLPLCQQVKYWVPLHTTRIISLVTVLQFFHFVHYAFSCNVDNWENVDHLRDILYFICARIRYNDIIFTHTRYIQITYIRVRTYIIRVGKTNFPFSFIRNLHVAIILVPTTNQLTIVNHAFSENCKL